MERVEKIARALSIKTERGSVTNDKGEKIEVVILHHGNHRLLAWMENEHCLLTYPMELAQGDSKLLAEQPMEIQQRLFTIIRREMLEGRSGYMMNFDDSKPPRLVQIRVEQKLVLDPEGIPSKQRLLDAVQELVVTAMRSQIVLGQAFSDVRDSNSSSDSDFHEGMYT